MIITAVFDAVASVEIEVPGGATEEECEAIANAWFAEDCNFCAICDEIAESPIELKEVWL